jgi:hypothetical protein
MQAQLPFVILCSAWSSPRLEAPTKLMSSSSTTVEIELEEERAMVRGNSQSSMESGTVHLVMSLSGAAIGNRR